jgi:hypothetical protein
LKKPQDQGLNHTCNYYLQPEEDVTIGVWWVSAMRLQGWGKEEPCSAILCPWHWILKYCLLIIIFTIPKAKGRSQLNLIVMMQDEMAPNSFWGFQSSKDL